MEITYKKSRKLSEDAKTIREKVFVEEQGFVTEFDEIDHSAVHLTFYENGNCIAVCRYYREKDTGDYSIGRIAVIKEYRGKNVGQYMLKVAEKLIREDGGSNVALSAQVRIKAFYEKLGYQETGEIYMDEYCEHICMKKELEGA